ncbi:ABC transporter ATP-binding protein [Prosthecodimorpha hirschii]|uniref:ABC transporter ATP-binding protein n=1 Tax=Prosthecodimorpha hirschii TaxID=665126 RepID=UPI001FEFD39B|nr:ABC transporter ATP-binding protein [Prosthecomicrobium hirschii]
MSRIEVQELTKVYEGRKAVAGISFRVEAGELCVLLGPSGCGKSTTLRLIAGLEDPDGGTIRIADREVTHLAPKDRRISMVFQSYALFPHLSVADNITFGLEVRGVPKAERRERLGKVAALVGLSDYLKRKPGQMSGGQRQAVAIARTRLAAAKIVLMDEPTAAISIRQVSEVLDLIRRLRDQGIAVILISHRMPDVFSVCDRVVVLRRGRKVADKPIAHSTPEEVTALITGAKETA